MFKTVNAIVRFDKPCRNNESMPVLPVCIMNIDTNEDILKVYLLPFKGYRFQISETPDGSGNLGESQICDGYDGFQNLLGKVDRPVGEFILREYAVEALQMFLESKHGGFQKNWKDGRPRIPNYIYDNLSMWCADDFYWRTFIKLTYNWIMYK